MAIPTSTNYGEKFAKKTQKRFYGVSITVPITNQDFEGDLSSGGGDRVNILQFLKDVQLTAYDPSSTMSTQKWVDDTESQLILDQKYYFDFQIDDLSKFFTYVDDLDSHLINQAAEVLAEQIDTYVLDLYTEVRAGHRIGSNINSTTQSLGAATVTNITGAVALADPGICKNPATAGGSTSGGFGELTLVGSGIQFAGDNNWYPISTFTDSNTIIITDWNDSAYTGGAKSAVAYIIEAFYPKVVTSSSIYADICTLKTALDNDKIPKTDRWLVVPPDITNLLIQASQLTPAIAMAYENVVLGGEIGRVAGFKIYQSVNVSGSATKGWHCLAGQKSFITFAHAFKETRIVDAESNFAKRYQGLNIYGAKVTIERRKAGADAFWIIANSGGDDWKEA